MTKKEYILDFLKEINYAYNHPSMYDDLKRLLDEMEEEILESANCKWIPVSERLPEDHQLVLTFDGEYICVEQRIPYIIGENGKHIESEWWVDVNYVPDSELYSGLRDGAAVAWMPLPTAYQPEIPTGAEGSEE